MTFSLAERHCMRERLRSETFDVLIVGGGITGAGIARDAALRGYRVALLEQDDFGFGTSSRSSRLIHGGVRYLEHGHIGLVFESLSERTRLAYIARHLVRPLPFLFPVYAGQRSMHTMDLGLWLYDALALFRNYRHHKRLSPTAVSRAVPGLRTAGLAGGFHYYDYQTDDARLVLENVLAAVAAGAVALSYTRVQGYERSGAHVGKVHVWDRMTEEPMTVRSRVVVCAVGPWTDRFLASVGKPQGYIQPTKGVHLVLRRGALPLDIALVMRHPRDHRVLFALPYYDSTVLGTTDTACVADPATVAATAEDVHYLLEAAQQHFPQAKLTPDQVRATWAGLRPLLGQDDAAGPSAVSREHRIEALSQGVVVIAGGKLTTYRRMAAECLAAVERVLSASGGASPRRRVTTHRLPLPGAMGLTSDTALDALAARLGRHLAYRYGQRADQVAILADSNGFLATPLVDDLPCLWAEVAFAIRHEMALTVADVLVRRTQLVYRAEDQGLSVVEAVAAYMAPYLGWDAAEQARQVEEYCALVAKSQEWKTAR